MNNFLLVGGIFLLTVLYVARVLRYASMIRKVIEIFRRVAELHNRMAGRERVARLTGDWEEEFKIVQNDLALLEREIDSFVRDEPLK